MITLRARLFAVVVITAALAGPLPSAAQSAKEKAPAKDKEPPVLPTHVQLTIPNAPLLNRDPPSTAVTFYLKAADKKALAAICDYAPRINDTLLRHLQANPIPVQGRGLKLAGVGGKALGPINGALGRPLVSEIEVLAGVPGGGAKKVITLPFGSAGDCRTIKEVLGKK
jgi:hypothetical protein